MDDNPSISVKLYFEGDEEPVCDEPISVKIIIPYHTGPGYPRSHPNQSDLESLEQSVRQVLSDSVAGLSVDREGGSRGWGFSQVETFDQAGLIRTDIEHLTNFYYY